MTMDLYQRMYTVSPAPSVLHRVPCFGLSELFVSLVSAMVVAISWVAHPAMEPKLQRFHLLTYNEPLGENIGHSGHNMGAYVWAIRVHEYIWCIS